ncbi:MaoC/PaaZ C-terminal domain-containing protein [Gordonia sp. NPDC127522]|uniref:MaoC/PaaZ C-terminal domain-containing protein n=1 Tax=Gordonia sp. NPDC127522 TaxID=3345390 RepID=UPI00362D3226
MTIDTRIAIGAELPEVSFSWTPSDVARYHLAVGAATDPTDRAGLAYVDDVAPKVLPSFATVAASLHTTEPPQVSFPGVNIDLAKVVHGSQQVVAHRPLPARGKAMTRTRIAAIQDKGSAAVIILEGVTRDESGELLWTTRSSIFAKGEGGFGGERGTSRKVQYPDREPDYRVSVPTLPQQALLYRLCGDRNPLHSDPEFAAKAGFTRPILHGLCTYGMVFRAIVDTLCGGDVAAIGDFSATFAGVVYPGEELVVSVWVDGEQLVATVAVSDREGAPALANVVCSQAG